MKRDNEIVKIRSLAGNLSAQELSHVETFVGKNVGIFIPSTGYCLYSIKENHTHPSYSFCYSFDKNVQMGVNGQIINAGIGEVGFIPPEIPHHEIMGESFTRFVAVLIDRKFFDKHSSSYGVESWTKEMHLFPVNESIRSSVRKFIIEVSEKKAGFDNLIESLEVILTHAFLRGMAGVKNEQQEIVNRLDIDRAIEYINAHYAESLSVEMMAEIVDLSPSHFSRLFKKEVEQSPLEYLIEVRISRARILLLQTDKSLTEIALECGFADSAHFASHIRKKYGMTPTQLRNSV